MIELTLQIEGTIIAPDEPEKWDPKLPRQWLEFTKLNAATFQGDGVIDGSGEKWWAESCKKNKSRVNFELSRCLFLRLCNSNANHFWFFFLQPCKGAPTVWTKPPQKP